MRVLILGGTAEARALAESLVGRQGVDVVSSLAGRIGRPVMPPGAVRIGGFGGTGGLARYLSDERISAVIDATHPYAVRISAHAADACASLGVPLVVLRRPGWSQAKGDHWIRVLDVSSAASSVASMSAGTVLLTLGRTGLAEFATDGEHHYVIRSVEPPAGLLPRRHTLVTARGPFTLDGERDLFREHGVDLLITRDSGGTSGLPKLAVASEYGLPVIMIDRPLLARSQASVTTIGEAAEWVARVARERPTRH